MGVNLCCIFHSFFVTGRSTQPTLAISRNCLGYSMLYNLLHVIDYLRFLFHMPVLCQSHQTMSHLIPLAPPCGRNKMQPFLFCVHITDRVRVKHHQSKQTHEYSMHCVSSKDRSHNLVTVHCGIHTPVKSIIPAACALLNAQSISK